MQNEKMPKRKTGRNILFIALGTVLVLLIPLALQLTIGTGVDGQGFNWTSGDFIIMGILIFGIGLVYELIASKVRSIKHRVILAIVLLLAFLLIWAELAVGIFGTPFAGS